jgi:hypothetical protein
MKKESKLNFLKVNPGSSTKKLVEVDVMTENKSPRDLQSSVVVPRNEKMVSGKDILESNRYMRRKKGPMVSNFNGTDNTSVNSILQIVKTDDVDTIKIKAAINPVILEVLSDSRFDRLITNPKMVGYLTSIGEIEDIDGHIYLEDKEKTNLLEPKEKKPNSKLPQTPQKAEPRSRLLEHIYTKLKTVLEYYPIALYLASKFDKHAQVRRMLKFNPNLQNESENIKCVELLDKTSFTELLVKCMVKYDEKPFFDMLLKEIVNWNIFFSEKVMESFMRRNKIEYLMNFLKRFNEVIVLENKITSKVQGGTGNGQVSKVESTELDAFAPLSKANQIGKDKIVFIIQSYFDQIEENKLLMELLKNLGLTDGEVGDLLMESEEEDRVMQIVMEYPEVGAKLDPKKIMEFKLYGLFTTVDQIELINVFNLPYTGGLDSTIYDELFDRIKGGENVQSIIFCLLHVSNTFWDVPKASVFFSAINGLFNSENISEWLLHVNNPLLFSIKIVYFLEKIENQLGMNDQEIKDLRKNLVAFCNSYIHQSGSRERQLKVTIFDKDNRGRDFLEFAFTVKEKSILESDFTERMIMFMWDLGRISLQTLKEYFKMYLVEKTNRELSLAMYTKKYEMPIEPNDEFQLDFKFASRSIFLKVTSEIVWSLTLVIIEFVFAMLAIALYRKGQFRDGWFFEYAYENIEFLVVHAYLRIAYMINIFIKMIALKGREMKFFAPNYFFIPLLVFYLVQMLIYPFFVSRSFWFFVNLQMAIVMTIVFYVTYIALSLQNVGVWLRIFNRFVAVVVIFGLVSIFIILAIAFPIHTLFIEFDSLIPGQTFPQMNYFQDLYIGVLTLFEFVFGAVVFIRPYKEQTVYTYAMTFVMVIFSFFGNIMLANLMVAFLTSQFTAITEDAKYLTLRMQFGLIKTLNFNQTDTLFSMPYVFTPLVLPFYACMFSPTKRPAVNFFLRKLVHISNTYFPTLLYRIVWLLLQMPKIYIEFIFRGLVRFFNSWRDPFHLILWIIIGPLFLTKLFFQDIYTLSAIVLNFSNAKMDDATDHFMNIIPEEEREQMTELYLNIYAVCYVQVKQRKIYRMKLKDVIFHVMELINSTTGYDPEEEERKPNDSSEENSDKDEAHTEQPNRTSNTRKAIFTLPNKNEVPLGKKYKNILANFVSDKDRREASTLSNTDLDLKFVLHKFKKHLKADQIHHLMVFDRVVLEKAKATMNTASDEIIHEVKYLKSKIDQIFAILQKDEE